MKIAGIYKITNKVNGKIYIGQSNNLLRRIRNHLHLRTSCDLKNDMIKFGLSNFKLEVLEFIDDNDDLKNVLNKREQYYINIHIDLGLSFESMFYNKISSIDDGKYEITELQKQRMSDSKKNKKLSSEHIKSITEFAKSHNTALRMLKHKPDIRNISKALRKKYPDILKYDIEGNFIDRFETQDEAAFSIGIKHGYNINKALKGSIKHAYGYQWRFYTENFPLKIESLFKRVQVFNYNKELIGKFDSVSDAANYLKINKDRVFYALNGSKYNYSCEHYFFYI